MAKGKGSKSKSKSTVAASAPVSTGASAASLPNKSDEPHSSVPDLAHLKLHGPDEGDTESAFQVEDEDGSSKQRSTASVASTSTPPLVDHAHKDSFFSFLKSIIGKDVDQVRVAVPLWLLEPVSNLEYLGGLEYLEHFVQAPAQPTPLARMVHVTTMLLSSLKKATKKAKKPINPILSEVFFANFHSGPKPTSSSTAKVGEEDDEVHQDQDDPTLPPVLLVGEQVSHHPPISAFYAACPATGINVTLLFDLKAKYTGLNFTMQNHSHATVSIPAHNELYHVTYPDANLTGVLTLNFHLMWTGSCAVECPQSGLTTTITFKEKRWFGRDTYELTGQITHKDGPKKALATLSGNWNSAIFVDYHDKVGPQLLFDSSTTAPAYHMHIPPRARAPPNFSHNVWGEVMSAMLAGDSGKANKLKTDVENKQRAVAKDRADGKLEPYVPRLFRYDPTAKEGPHTGRVEYIGGELPDRKADLVAWYDQCGKPAGTASDSS